jgi:hypothetical protein
MDIEGMVVEDNGRVLDGGEIAVLQTRGVGGGGIFDSGSGDISGGGSGDDGVMFHINLTSELLIMR